MSSRLVLVPFLIPIVACVSLPRPMLDLSPKSRQVDQGFESLLFWRLQIQDDTGTRLTRYYPRFVVGPPGSAERVASGVLEPMTIREYFATHYKTVAVDGGWESGEEKSSFDGLYAVEARAGSYEVFQLAFDRKRTDIVGDSAGIVQLAIACEVPPNSLGYLGLLQVTVAHRTGDHYAFVVDGHEGDVEADLATVDRLFPGARDQLPAEPARQCTFTKVDATVDITN